MSRPRRSLAALLASCLLVAIAWSTGAQEPLPPSAATLAEPGWEAVEAGHYGAALTAFTRAADAFPDAPLPWLGRGLAAFMLGRDGEAETSLRRALDLAPAMTEAGRLLGLLHQRQGRLDEAIAVYEAALRHAPADADLASRLEEWRRDTRLQDGFARARGTHFHVLFEGPADAALARRVVGMLEGAYRTVGGVLRAYPVEPVTVVLYTQQQFQDLTRAPGWAAGIYDGRIRVPVRGALDRRDELERVLTHEFVHVLVAALGGRAVPTWLNEGLATALEPGGVERASRVLTAAGARPTLAQLHTGFAHLSGSSAAVAYALSALAVDRLLSLGGPAAMVRLLEDLARGVPFDSAFRHRLGLPLDEFERIVSRVR